MAPREEPIVVKATHPPSDPAHSAAIIFLHGLGSHAQEWQDVANQFQNANKLPYMQWIFPNALENRDAMEMAWYRPTSLAPPPAGRPELADEEDEEGLRESIAYVESLLDDLTSKGVPSDRIVVAGFSQGCALTLATELTSRYSGRLAGVAGLMGYLPIPERIQDLRTEAGLSHIVGEVPAFLAKGGADRLIPRSKWEQSLQKLRELGMSESAMEVHEYPGLGHAVSATLLRDLCSWLEKVVPGLE